MALVAGLVENSSTGTGSAIATVWCISGAVCDVLWQALVVAQVVTAGTCCAVVAVCGVSGAVSHVLR